MTHKSFINQNEKGCFSKPCSKYGNDDELCENQEGSAEELTKFTALVIAGG